MAEENEFEELKPLRWGSFTTTQRNKILSLGKSVVEKWKEGTDDDKLNRILSFKKSGVRVMFPSQEYVDKNLEDLNWVLSGPGLMINQFNTKREKLKSQRESLLNGTFLIFVEDGKWSEMNLFNSNILNWIHLIQEYLKGSPKFLELVMNKGGVDNLDVVIDLFFEPDLYDGDKSFAENAFFYSVLEKLEETKVRLSRTWDKGVDVENRFIDFVIEKYGADNVKNFMSKGGIVDQMTGVDLCLFSQNVWTPIQIKSSESEAKKSVPIDGFSVYPKDDGWNIVRFEKFRM